MRVGVGGTDLEDVFLRVGDEEERRRANLLSALPPARDFALGRRQRVARAAKTGAGPGDEAAPDGLARSWTDGIVRRLPIAAAVLAVRVQRAGRLLGARVVPRERDDVRYLHEPASYYLQTTRSLAWRSDRLSRAGIGFVPLVGLMPNMSAERQAAQRAHCGRLMRERTGDALRRPLSLGRRALFFHGRDDNGYVRRALQAGPVGRRHCYNRAEHLSQAVADTPPEFLDLGAPSTAEGARGLPRPIYR